MPGTLHSSAPHALPSYISEMPLRWALLPLLCWWGTHSQGGCPAGSGALNETASRSLHPSTASSIPLCLTRSHLPLIVTHSLPIGLHRVRSFFLLIAMLSSRHPLFIITDYTFLNQRQPNATQRPLTPKWSHAQATIPRASCKAVQVAHCVRDTRPMRLHGRLRSCPYPSQQASKPWSLERAPRRKGAILV